MTDINKTPFVIVGTDYLLSKYPDYGVRNPFNLMIGFEYDKESTEISTEDSIFASMNQFNSIIEFAISKGYIIRPKDNSSTVMYEITDLGREVKFVGSHTKYVELKANKELAVFENIKWSKKAAEAAERSATAAEQTSGFTKNSMYLMIIYVLLTLIIMITGIVTCNYAKRPQTTQTNANSSHTDTKESRATDTIR
jgi:hypothetical protein